MLSGRHYDNNENLIDFAEVVQRKSEITNPGATNPTLRLDPPGYELYGRIGLFGQDQEGVPVGTETAMPVMKMLYSVVGELMKPIYARDNIFKDDRLWDIKLS